MKSNILKQHRIPTYATLVALTFGVSANAATLTLTGLDSFIRSKSGEDHKNNSAAEALLIGEVSTADEMRGVFSFALTDPLLAGATINSISLLLTGERQDASSSGTMTIGLHEVTTSFTSSVDWVHTTHDTPSWTAAGGDFGSVLATVSADTDVFGAGDVHTYASAALTSAGAANVGGTFSLLAKNQSVDATRSIFFYEAAGGALVEPRLIIDYTVVPEPSSTALLGLGGLALILRRRR